MSGERTFGGRVEGECVADGFTVPWLVECRYTDERPEVLAVEVMTKRGPAMVTDVATVFLDERDLEAVIDMLSEQRRKLRSATAARRLSEKGLLG